MLKSHAADVDKLDALTEIMDNAIEATKRSDLCPIRRVKVEINEMNRTVIVRDNG